MTGKISTGNNRYFYRRSFWWITFSEWPAEKRFSNY